MVSPIQTPHAKELLVASGQDIVIPSLYWPTKVVDAAMNRAQTFLGVSKGTETSDRSTFRGIGFVHPSVSGGERARSGFYVRSPKSNFCVPSFDHERS